MKTNKYKYFILFTLLNVFSFAQPPTIPVPGGGGTGGSGTGAAASPIDMYIYVLAIIAVGFAVYFSKKYAKQLTK